MIKITKESGFFMKFENGYGISVQFNAGNYCNNRYLTKSREELSRLGSSNAECAIINPDDKLVYIDEWQDSVRGYCKPAEILEIMEMAANWKDEGRAS